MIHPLTSLGRSQALSAGAEIARIASRIGGGVEWVSSPFRRAVQTCEIAREEAMRSMPEDLEVGTVTRAEEFRERFFGRLDGMGLETYGFVWPGDRIETGSAGFEVESVEEVWVRVRRGVDMCERRWEGKVVVVGGHADTSQIMQVGYARGGGADVYLGDFSSFRFANGEVRVLGEALPDPKEMEPPKWYKG